MHHLFVSYSRTDADLVRPVVEALRSHDLPVWIDESDIPASVPWMDEIESAIESSRLVVVFQSFAWYSSTVCRKELEFAESSEKPILFLDPATTTPSDLVRAVRARLSQGTPGQRLQTELLTGARNWHRSGRKGYLLPNRRRTVQLRAGAGAGGLGDREPVRSFLVAASRRDRTKRLVAGALTFSAVVAQLGFFTAGRTSELLKEQAQDEVVVTEAAIQADLQARTEPVEFLAAASAPAGPDNYHFNMEQSHLAHVLSQPWPSARHEGVTPTDAALLIDSPDVRQPSDRSALLTPDGAVAVSGPSGELLRLLRGPSPAIAYFWSPDFDEIAIASATEVTIANVDTGHVRLRLATRGLVPEQVAWSSSGVLTATEETTLLQWDLAEYESTPPSSDVWIISGAPIGSELDFAVVTREGDLGQLSVDGEFEKVESPGDAYAVASAPSGDRFTVASRGPDVDVTMFDSGFTRLWSTPVPNCTSLSIETTGERTTVTCRELAMVTLGPDGQIERRLDTEYPVVGIVSASDGLVARHKSGAVVDLGPDGTGERVIPWGPCDAPIARLAASSPSSARVAHASAGTASGLCTPDVVDLEEGTGHQVIFQSPTVARSQAVAASPDGRLFAWGFDDGVISVVTQDGLAAVLTDRTLADQVRALGFSPDSSTLTGIARDGHVVTLDV